MASASIPLHNPNQRRQIQLSEPVGESRFNPAEIRSNTKALQVLGIDPIRARERGYPMEAQNTIAEEEDLTAA
jgi:hypothetical protein